MSPNAKLAAAALSISFLGSLPPGTLNLSVAGYAFRQDRPGAIGFSIAAILVEMMIVLVATTAIHRLGGLKPSLPIFRHLRRLPDARPIFQILTIAILLVFAFNSLLAAGRMEPFQAGIPPSFLNPWLSGLVLSATNPLHLPFWLGWTAILRSKHLLTGRPSSRNTFIASIGLGTAAAFTIYGFAGDHLIQLFGNHQSLLNGGVGLTLLVTAGAQLYKLARHATGVVARR